MHCKDSAVEPYVTKAITVIKTCANYTRVGTVIKVSDALQRSGFFLINKQSYSSKINKYDREDLKE